MREELLVTVNIFLSATLRNAVPEYSPGPGLSLEMRGPLSTGELAESIGLPRTAITLVMVNGRHASLEHIVRDGDRVSYFPPIGGG
jgi:sulfur carrier protein ThiS